MHNPAKFFFSHAIDTKDTVFGLDTHFDAETCNSFQKSIRIPFLKITK